MRMMRHTVGLKSDGTVVAVGDDIRANWMWKDGRTSCKWLPGLVTPWVEVRRHGGGRGDNLDRSMDVEDGRTSYRWPPDVHTVGLKSDGTVVAVGDMIWRPVGCGRMDGHRASGRWVRITPWG